MIVGASQVFHVAVNVADTDLRQNNCRASAGVISQSFLPEESLFGGVMWPGRGLQPKFTHPLAGMGSKLGLQSAHCDEICCRDKCPQPVPAHLSR